jgi:hypothetical protein
MPQVRPVLETFLDVYDRESRWRVAEVRALLERTSGLRPPSDSVATARSPTIAAASCTSTAGWKYALRTLAEKHARRGYLA